MTAGPSRRRLVVSPTDEGTPLHEFLAARVLGLSSRAARLLIALGGIFLDGARAEMPVGPLRAGQIVEALLGGELERAARRAGEKVGAPAIAAARYQILHEDDDVCVVDKPAGLLTERFPDSPGESLAELLVERWARSGSPAEGRVWIVQRLDRPTSGVLVIAKTVAANRVLATKLQRREVEREYLAVVRGALPEETRILDAPLRGRRAITRVAVVQRFGGLATRLSCVLETGRTHQIRLHLARIGHPVMGDPRHGQRTAWDPPRLALHARRLAFEHPRTGERLVFESPWPKDLSPWIDDLAALAREAEAAHPDQ